MDEISQRAAREFGVSYQTDARSLCPYGPVYRVTGHGREWVLKRTGVPNSSGLAIGNWLRQLNLSDVDVVKPSELFRPNPRRLPFADNTEWVIYPFIEGKQYSGTEAEIQAAGALLGKMHVAGARGGSDLLRREQLPMHNELWIAREIEKSQSLISEHVPELAWRWGNIICRFQEIHAEAVARLSAVRLPLAACSWDYKASNLVFVSPDRPVLIDPDHAGKIPRLYDLASALLLFHCDLSSAPARVLKPREWRLFVEGYLRFVAFEQVERAAWADVLVAAWMDQGLWLLANWPEGWLDRRERAHLISLATIDLRRYGLGRGTSMRALAEPVARFLDESGRLKIYPAARQDRIHALHFLIKHFDPTKVYREKEVNELLNQLHTFGDWALLRRELSDLGFLRRNSKTGTYIVSVDQPG